MKKINNFDPKDIQRVDKIDWRRMRRNAFLDIKSELNTIAVIQAWRSHVSTNPAPPPLVGIIIHSLIHSFIHFEDSTSTTRTAEAAAVEEAAKKCCQSGLLCSTNDFEGLCCRTMDCLQNCYGPTFFQRFRDRGFKYLDILLRPSADDEKKAENNLENLAEKVEKELVELEEALVRKIAKEVDEEKATEGDANQ